MLLLISMDYADLPYQNADHFFDLTPDVVCIAGKDGFFRRVNKAFIRKLAYSEAELMAQPISYFIYEGDKILTQQERVKLLAGEPLVNFQNRYVTKNGDVVWLDWTSIYFAEKEVVFAIAKDITARKKIETDVEASYKKFKGLATHFKGRIEKDRKYFAVELHESVAQLAAAIKMDIELIKLHSPELPEFLKGRVDHVSSVSELLIRTIQRIAFSVSPYMLDGLGLNETLSWLCKEFTILNKIPCNFSSDYDETDMTQEVKIDFFRICQEALSNIAYHANASSVLIKIVGIGDKINLSIMDDGDGFVFEKVDNLSGLNTMRELVTSIQGQFDLISVPGEGTIVSVSIKRNGSG